MSKFGKELIESMQQAAKHANGGKVRGMRVTAVELPDVKAIRKKLHIEELGAGQTGTGCAGGGLSPRHSASAEGSHGSGCRLGTGLQPTRPRRTHPALSQNAVTAARFGVSFF